MRPKNKFERNVIAKKKGERRAKKISAGWEFSNFDKDLWVLKNSRRLRNTTKLCSCSMCANKRKSKWDNPLTLQEQRQLEMESCQGLSYDELPPGVFDELKMIPNEEYIMREYLEINNQ